MRNIFGHILSLWKLAFHLLCILTRTYYFPAVSESTVHSLSWLKICSFPFEFHLSSCETCAPKNNRITFSQDNICFAECIPHTGHHPAVGDPGGRESEVLTLQFKPQSTEDLHFGFREVIIFSFFFGGGTLSWPPRDIRTNRMCSIVLKSAGSAYIFHLKLLSIWLIHWRTPPQWTVRVWFNLQENWH